MQCAMAASSISNPAFESGIAEAVPIAAYSWAYSDAFLHAGGMHLSQGGTNPFGFPNSSSSNSSHDAFDRI